MCGISGIINKENVSVDFRLIEKMNDLVSHRGPDGEGFYMKNNFAFGHRRLAIIDLSEAGKQPMTYKDRYTITFNGEIYNYLEIKSELKLLGYHFESHTDTEVILAAYDKWKENCFTHFNGMWSLAIYDKVENEIICSRDRFGVKPFYYSQTNQYFVFGSEIKQCLIFFDTIKANMPIVMDYLALNITDHTTNTFFKDISCLKGGHYLKYDLNANNFSIKKYYSITIHPKYATIDYEEGKKLFREEFERSISWRLRSDVTVGTCLSGGLDSSFIAAVAAKKHYQVSKNTFKAITAEAIDEEVNEVKYAKLVSSYTNLELHITRPSTDDFWKEIDKLILIQEEPFGSPSVAMQYFVMREAKKAGITVLLDGQGADESLLGYSRYIAALMKGKGIIGKLKILKKASSRYDTSFNELLRIYFYFTNSFVRKRRIKQRCGNIKNQYLNLANWGFIKELSRRFSNATDLQKFEITTSQIPQLLKWEDKNSMYYSIETRLPFLDWQLVEYNLSIPAEFKIRNGWSKFIIRDNMKNLVPDEVAWRRKKFGFNAPLRSWFERKSEMLAFIQKSKFLKEIMNVDKINPDDANYFWRIYNLAKWVELYNVQL